MEKWLRSFFLFLSDNKAIERFSKKYGRKLGASRFVAGEAVEEAAEVVKELNEENLSVTLDFLGEFVTCEKEASERTSIYVNAVEAIVQHGLESQISVKLTSLGLDISYEVAKRNIIQILEAAKKKGVFVTLDMEDFARCERTLELFKELRTEYDNVGTVLQAYLYRTVKDLEDLDSLNPNLRLVKGAYEESEEVAYRVKSDVDENFRKIIRLQLLRGHFTAIATHDERIIEYTKGFVQDYAIPREQFEFQMLYGIRSERQRELAREGYNMRVYVPFGSDWYGYFMRRMAERPANAAFVIKGLFQK